MRARSALQWSDGAAGPVLRLVRPADRPPCSSDPELFFPDSSVTAGPAIAICAACPLRAECLQAARCRRDTYGVWGGVLFVRGEAQKLARPRPRRPAIRRTSISLWCRNDHRRTSENTRENSVTGQIVCLDCQRDRTTRKRQNDREAVA